ncbi:putative porin [Rhodohalobacter sp.]|uniref:putative porin n=1 Tax=Rhodohalobacter sp. TaxID=1974210 RepID=UPI002ACE1684|nr:putative porin [Rhodohalobacter sp.]MDZ7756582.1 putative porin [Rhodohalobacter sp.]
MNYSADSIATDFKQAELFARHRLNLGRTDVSFQGSVNWLNESAQKNLTEESWLGAQGRIDLNIRPFSWLQLQSYSTAEYWDDERLSSEVSGRLTLFPDSRITLSGFGGYLNRSPDLQALYWQSSFYTGDSTLENEQEISMGGMIEYQILNWMNTGVRADLRLNENSVFINASNQFENIDPYTNISGTGWIGLDSRIFEGEFSAVYKSFLNDSDNPVNLQLEESGDRIWLKGHLYWKNYLFDRATYVKAGISGMMSPSVFGTAEYITPLNRWQHGTNSLGNPSYHRLDVDVSARIRWFMLLLKWENVLDGVDQLGYFESTGYPMPERRFRLGLRILFTN